MDTWSSHNYYHQYITGSVTLASDQHINHYLCQELFNLHCHCVKHVFTATPVQQGGGIAEKHDHRHTFIVSNMCSLSYSSSTAGKLVLIALKNIHITAILSSICSLLFWFNMGAVLTKKHSQNNMHFFFNSCTLVSTFLFCSWQLYSCDNCLYSHHWIK